MAEKQDGRNAVPESGCVGWNHVPTWKSLPWTVMCERNKHLYPLYIRGLFLEQLSFTLVNVGLFLLLVCLYLKNNVGLYFFVCPMTSI